MASTFLIKTLVEVRLILPGESPRPTWNSFAGLRVCVCVTEELVEVYAEVG